MTHEKRYALCCEALRAADALQGAEPGALVKLFEMDPAAAARNPYIPILAALAPIMQEAREAMDKANSSGAVLSSLKRIAKAATRKEMRGGWIDAAGRYCVCSGFHAVRIPGGRFDSIPAVAAWAGLEKCLERPADLHRIELPSVADVKTWQATHGKRERMPIDEGRRYVDPAYMLDMLQALPGAVAWATENPLHPIWFDCEKGDGILLPMRAPAAK